MEAKEKAPPPRPTRVEVAPCHVPDAPPASRDRVGRVAVIVAHGMGQQVPFETVELVAEIARRGETARTGLTQNIVTRIVRLERSPQSQPPGDTFAVRTPTGRISDPRELARAEVRVTDSRGEWR